MALIKGRGILSAGDLVEVWVFPRPSRRGLLLFLCGGRDGSGWRTNCGHRESDALERCLFVDILVTSNCESGTSAAMAELAIPVTVG